MQEDRRWKEVYGDLQRYGPAHRHLRRLLRSHIADFAHRTVLDVGCGDGSNRSLVEVTDDAYTGLDVSGEALARSQARSRGRFLQADIQHAAPDGEWDLVLCSLLLEHLTDDVAALENMRKVCRVGFVTATIGGDASRYPRWERRVGHVRNYVHGELEGKLRDAGFEPVRTTRWGFPFYSPIGRRLQEVAPAPAPEMGMPGRLIAGALFLLYGLNSTRRGDLIVVSARPR